MIPPLPTSLRCSRAGFDAVYILHPGAGSLPYFRPYLLGGLPTNTSEVLRLSRQRILRRIERDPTFVVVDASLRDAEAWWKLATIAPDPRVGSSSFTRRAAAARTRWPPHHLVQHWCTVEVPALLQEAQAVYPTARIAFRTAPRTALKDPPQNAETIDAMTKCLWEHTTPEWKLHGQFDLIPYHELVNALALFPKATSGKLWPDLQHPAPQAQDLYLASVLVWTQQGLGTLREPLTGPRPGRF